VKNSCDILISVRSCVLLVAIVIVPILRISGCLAYVIFDRPSLFYGAAAFSISCPGLLVPSILAVFRGEGNLVCMNS
jgi:hypothetical protein